MRDLAVLQVDRWGRKSRNKMMKLAIVLFLAVIGVSLASSDDGPITAKTIQKVGANAYVYNPLLLGTNGTQVGFTDEKYTGLLVINLY
jgi:hypothetical protein